MTRFFYDDFCLSHDDFDIRADPLLPLVESNFIRDYKSWNAASGTSARSEERRLEAQTHPGTRCKVGRRAVLRSSGEAALGQGNCTPSWGRWGGWEDVGRPNSCGPEPPTPPSDSPL